MIEDYQWYLGRTYEFRITWTTQKIYCGLDGKTLVVFPFEGQEDPIKYVLIGRDNLIWGYCAQPGSIYFDLRIYSTGESNADLQPPDLLAVTVLDDSTLLAEFSEILDATSATTENNYRIDSDVTIKRAELANNGSAVRLSTSAHPATGKYTLWEKGKIKHLRLPRRMFGFCLSQSEPRKWIRDCPKSRKNLQNPDPSFVCGSDAVNLPCGLELKIKIQRKGAKTQRRYESISSSAPEGV
ncbi:hypothetical protein JXO59_07180 [candidate division KSB1 bacterium]|nr:hypothetical protein [candidate division KSB1 bacterium]